MGLDLRVAGLRALHQVGDDDVGVGPQGRDLQDERVQPVDRVGDVQALPEVVGPDVHQHHVRVLHRVEPAFDVGIVLIDPPSAVPLVVHVRQECPVVGERSDVVDIVARRRQ